MLRAFLAAVLLTALLLPAANARVGDDCGVYSPGLRPPADLYCEDEEGWCAVWFRNTDACVGAGTVPPWPLE